MKVLSVQRHTLSAGYSEMRNKAIGYSRAPLLRMGDARFERRFSCCNVIDRRDTKHGWTSS